MESFKIVLNKQIPVYHSGETVSGSVLISLTQPMKCNEVLINILGKARVYWNERYMRGEKAHYRAEEEYLNETITLLQKEPAKNFYLKVGEHSYPFQISLPYKLPTSFEHVLGRIRYSITAKINISMVYYEHTKMIFSVLNYCDLNLLSPLIRQPFEDSGSKTFCCFWFASEPIFAKFSIPKAGFVPGEVIKFTIIIDNKSNRVLDKISVELVQNLLFRVRRNKKTIDRTVAESFLNHKIQPKTVENWNTGHLIIPAVCHSSLVQKQFQTQSVQSLNNEVATISWPVNEESPLELGEVNFISATNNDGNELNEIDLSSKNTCKIIEISYNLVLTFGTNFSIDFELSIPIVIGTVPLKNTNLKDMPPINQSEIISECQLDEIGTPTYEKCIFSSETSKENITRYTKSEKIESNSPFYPVYKIYSN